MGTNDLKPKIGIFRVLLVGTKLFKSSNKVYPPKKEIVSTPVLGNFIEYGTSELLDIACYASPKYFPTFDNGFRSCVINQYAYKTGFKVRRPSNRHRGSKFGDLQKWIIPLRASEFLGHFLG